MMRLPGEELQAFVQGFLQNRPRYLEALEAAPPPLYLLDREALRDSARRFRRCFEQRLPGSRTYFAVKSNNHPATARTLLAEGLGLDVSSGRELSMALSLGARDIVFSGPGKTDAELSLAADNAREVVVLLDSFNELDRLEAIASSRNISVGTGVRLTTSRSGTWRKFGIPLDQLSSFIRQAQKCEHVRLRGLQFHTSWNLSAVPQTAFIRNLGETLEKLPQESLRPIEFIDVGGGYWPERGEWLHSLPEDHPPGARTTSPTVHYKLPAAPLENFAEEIARALHADLRSVFPCRVFLEPGRWICNDAMHLILRVVDKKAPDLVITDAGTNAVGWERFETDYFPVLNLTRPSLDEKPCNILGSLCTPHDVFGFAYFGEDIRIGDVLMIPCQGAYTYSLKQEFIKPAPEVKIC
ncbi:MAG: alanine racemase [Desulfobacteraceae bacterium]|nr:alanine racemase [Desulfobacteraceae bacterium]